MWWNKKPKPKTFMQKLSEFKMAITSVMAVFIAFGYFYGFVKPDFESFKQTKVESVVVGQGLFVNIESNKIPNVPVTISFVVDGVAVAHRHYSLGIPSVKGLHYEEGRAEWIEPIPLLFALEKAEVTVRFSFLGLKTLLIPEVITFNATIYDGNQQSSPAPKTKRTPFLKWRI